MESRSNKPVNLHDEKTPDFSSAPFGTPAEVLYKLHSAMMASSGVAGRLEDLAPGMVFFCLPPSSDGSKSRIALLRCWMFLELQCPVLIKSVQNFLNAFVAKATFTRKFNNLARKQINGNLQAPLALEMGAALVVVYSRKVRGDRILYVDDTERAYCDLAWFVRRQSRDMPCIGITGSCGKTTTKELVNAVLASTFNTVSTHENSNTLRGVCRTLFSIDRETSKAVVEMSATGMSQAIRQQCLIAQPTHGLITNIGQAHLEGFGGIDGVVKVKRQLYDYLVQNSGSFFLNSDDTKVVEICEGRQDLWTYGTTKNARTHGEVIGSGSRLSVRWYLDQEEASATGKDYLDINTRLFGAFNVSNVLAAIAVGRSLHILPSRIVEALENYEPRLSRSQLIKQGTTTYIMDAYNANPTSMAAALDAFLAMDAARKVVILGDMKEGGAFSEDAHRAVVKKLEKHPAVVVILVGSEFAKVRNERIDNHFSNVHQLKEWLPGQDLQNTHVLIKGSHSVGLESLLDTQEPAHGSVLVT